MFTGIFTCNHPDTLILIVILIYYSRELEYSKGSIKYLIVFIVSLIFGSLPYVLLGIN